MKLSDHPTVKAYREKNKTPELPDRLGAEYLKGAALDAGVDAAGLIDLSRDTMSDYRQDLLDVMPDTKSIMVLAFRINQTPLRSRAHSIANHEFQYSWTRVKHLQSQLINQLKLSGIKSLGMPIGFPMEMER